MYTDIDQRGFISINEISSEDAATLVDAICDYLSQGPMTEADRKLITIKKGLEQCISTTQTPAES